MSRSTCVLIAKKPIFSREGANIELIKYGMVLEKSEGEYGKEGYIYQKLVDIPQFGGNYPVLGSWIIGGEACGMGIRENSSRITDNVSHLVPHIIKGAFYDIKCIGTHDLELQILCRFCHEIPSQGFFMADAVYTN